MIGFMVLCAPRSGSAWAANLLTTDTTLCLHDPLGRYHYTELDQIRSTKRIGVACTALALFPQYVNQHPAPKVILHRPFEEVNASLLAMGGPPLPLMWDGALDKIEGMHLPWTAMFTDPKAMYRHLLGKELDEERWEELLRLNIQFAPEKATVNPVAARRFFADLAAKGRAQ